MEMNKYNVLNIFAVVSASNLLSFKYAKSMKAHNEIQEFYTQLVTYIRL